MRNKKTIVTTSYITVWKDLYYPTSTIHVSIPTLNNRQNTNSELVHTFSEI